MMEGGRWGGDRVDWLVLALWMGCVVVENWYHSQRERERDLGEIMKWKEQVYSKQRERERARSDIKCIYTQACFFFLPTASSFSSPPPPFSVTALKGLMFILKDISIPELLHTHTSHKLTHMHMNGQPASHLIYVKSRVKQRFQAAGYLHLWTSKLQHFTTGRFL